MNTKEQGLPELPQNVTEDQRRAIQSFVHSAIVPLIEDVIVKKLGQAAIVLRDELSGAALASDTGGRGVVGLDPLDLANAARIGQLEQELAALRAQPAGGGCESCDGKGFVVRYHDPYSRGDVSSPYDAPCGDCPTPPESGGQGEAAAEVCRPGHPRPDSATFVRLLHDNIPDGTKLYTHPPAQASGAVTMPQERPKSLDKIITTRGYAEIYAALAQGGGNER